MTMWRLWSVCNASDWSQKTPWDASISWEARGSTSPPTIPKCKCLYKICPDLKITVRWWLFDHREISSLGVMRPLLTIISVLWVYFGQFRYHVITTSPPDMFLVVSANAGSGNFQKSHRVSLQLLICRDETLKLHSETGIIEKKHIHVDCMRHIFWWDRFWSSNLGQRKEEQS